MTSHIYRLLTPTTDDYPTVDWRRGTNVRAAERLLEIDSELRSGGNPSSLSGPNLALHGVAPDLLDLSPGLGLSARARQAMLALSVSGLRFVRFSVNGDPYFLTYTSRVLDCLDLAHSELEHFTATPMRVMRIQKYSFKRNALAEIDVFTLPQESEGPFMWSHPLYFTEAAMAQVVAAHLYTPAFTAVGAAA